MKRVVEGGGWGQCGQLTGGVANNEFTFKKKKKKDLPLLLFRFEYSQFCSKNISTLFKEIYNKRDVCVFFIAQNNTLSLANYQIA